MPTIVISARRRQGSHAVITAQLKLVLPEAKLVGAHSQIVRGHSQVVGSDADP